MKQSPRPPRFVSIQVLFLGLLLYLVMTGFFASFFVAKELLRSQGTDHHPNQNQLQQRIQERQQNDEFIAMIEGAVLVFVSAVSIAYHRPIRRYFQDLRRGRTSPPEIVLKARRRIWKSPRLLGLWFPCFYAAVNTVMVLLTFLLNASDHLKMVHSHLFLFSFVTIPLSGLFTYLWQRRRVQRLYVPFLFTPQERSQELPPISGASIRRSLTSLIILSTLLPLGLVLMFLFSGLQSVGDVVKLTTDQWSILLGDVQMAQKAGGLVALFGLEHFPFYYVNALDTLRILTGITLGLAIILVYVFLIVRWTAEDMIKPLLTLSGSLKQVEEEDFSLRFPVTSSNEIGKLTLGFNRMLQGLEERNKIKHLFGQYLTAEVSQAILDGRVNLQGDRYDVTVMFTDIRNFTSMAEELTPEEVFQFLNEYLDAMIEVLVDHGGFIDKFLGDGILTVFGLPVRHQDHARQALEAAVAMGKKLDEVNARRREEGKSPIGIGSGLHTGPVIAGNVGSSRKLQFTVIGDTVNLASRIEGLNKAYGSSILLSRETWEHLSPEIRDAHRFERLDQVEIRGKKESVTLFALKT